MDGTTHPQRPQLLSQSPESGSKRTFASSLCFFLKTDIEFDSLFRDPAPAYDFSIYKRPYLK